MSQKKRSDVKGASAHGDPAGTGEEEPLALETDDEEVVAVAPGNPRVITVVGFIDQETVQRVAEQLAVLNQESPLPILVQISSSGGSIIAGWTLHEMFVTNAVPIVTVGYGYVGSAATVAFQGGIKRFLTSNTTLMIHEVSLTVPEGTTFDAEKLRQQTREMVDLQKGVERLFVRRTGLPLKRIRALCKAETEFTAVRAVKAGFADKIVRGRRMPKPKKRRR